MTPTQTRPSPAADNLPELFLAQLGWLVQGSLEARRGFETWLDAELPADLAAVLAQASRVAARHRSELKDALTELALTLPPTEAPPVRAMLSEGDACLAAPVPDHVRHAALFGTIDHIATCFSTACASAAETATVLDRPELADLLVAWAAAWRDLDAYLHGVNAPVQHHSG